MAAFELAEGNTPAKGEGDNEKVLSGKNGDGVDEMKERLEKMEGSVEKLVSTMTNVVEAINEKKQQEIEPEDANGNNWNYNEDYNEGDNVDAKPFVNEHGEIDPVKLDSYIEEKANKVADARVGKAEKKIETDKAHDKLEAKYNQRVYENFPEVFDKGHLMHKETNRIWERMSKDPMDKDRPDLMYRAAMEAFTTLARSGKMDEVSLKKRDIYAGDAAGQPRGSGTNNANASTEPSNSQKMIAEKFGIKTDKIKDILTKKRKIK